MGTWGNRSGRVGLLLAVLLCVGAPGWAQGKVTVMVPMRDGVRLATDYYLPQGGAAPYPVVLTRTFYNKDGGAGAAAAYNDWGYAYVIQDTRGRFASEGVSNAFLDDGWGTKQDGVDTLAWIRGQPWCDGNIATSGASALGITQVLMAAAGGDATCQSMGVAPATFYDGLAYTGGVFLKNLFEGWATGQGIGHVVALYQAHPTYDEFWVGHDAGARAGLVTAPGFHWGGWFDIFQQGTIDNFVTRQHDGGPGARGNQKLLIGPWAHGFSQTVGELTFPDNWGFDIYGYEARFFDYWAKGANTGIMDEAPVHYYTMGACGEAGAPGNEWRTGQDWPPFPSVERAYRIGPGGGLSPDAAALDAAQTFTYDPADPCPTRGGPNLLMTAGPMDQRAVSGRPDVLSYATPPLPRPLEITGRVRVRLFVSSDAPDTDFTAKLVDIYPDGREMLMLDGIRRVKFRNGFETADPLPPGRIGEVEIDLWSISLIFNAGHRIGLQVSSSNYPRFEVNSNTGEDFPGAGGLRVAQNSVHSGPTYPSALLLPLRDFDGDSLPDYDEEALGSDPDRFDTDGDGLSDGYEAGYDGDVADYDPYDPVTSVGGTDLDFLEMDTDGDGVPDGLEVYSGTDPLDAGDAPPLPTAGATGLIGLGLALVAVGCGLGRRWRLFAGSGRQ